MIKVMFIWISLAYPLADLGLANAGSATIRRVVSIAVDGVRESEAQPVFQELRKKMMELGLASYWKGKADRCVPSQNLNLSLPAYASIFSGRVQRDIINNHFQGRLAHPTLFDEFPDSQLFSAWKPITYAMSNEFDTLSRAFISGYGNKPGEDIFVMQSFRLVHDFSNRFVFIHLGDADEYAHIGNWGGYTEAIRREADYVHEIIQTSEIKGMKETAYFIFSDHGRGNVSWQHHGENVPESNTMWMLEINPVKQPLMTGECNHVELHHAMARLARDNY